MNSITSLTLYDSYKKKEITYAPDWTVNPGWITLYSCGPTVYYNQHIGNYRAAWLGDTIARVARFAGWQVRWVLNITDVGHLVGDGDDGQNVTAGEDKLEKGAKRDNKDVREVVDHYTNDFVVQAHKLHIQLPQGILRPFATQYIKEQMMIALQLVVDNRAYFLEDGIYFDSQANQDLNIPFVLQQDGDNQFTDRDIKNTQKSPADFALWKFVSPDSLQKWQFDKYPEAVQLLDRIPVDKKPQGVATIDGCPGWHSECVAMIGGLFGYFNGDKTNDAGIAGVGVFSFSDFAQRKSVIDIHTGGEDHIDIHHKNEILQSEALGFHLSRGWVHNKFVTADGKKMAKSVGNVYMPDDIVNKGYDLLAYRMMLLEHHYGQQLDFTWDKLAQSNARLLGLRKDIAAIRSLVEKDETFIATELQATQKQLYTDILVDNLNTPLFLEKFQKLVNEVLERVIREKTFNSANISMIKALENEILALDLWPEIPNNVIERAQERGRAKEARDYAQADMIRAQIQEQGFDIGDYAWGYALWKVR